MAAVSSYSSDTVYLDIVANGDSVAGSARTARGRFASTDPYYPVNGTFKGRINHSLASREISLRPDTGYKGPSIWISITSIDSARGTAFGKYYGDKLDLVKQ